jgi:hypothetical protein
MRDGHSTVEEMGTHNNCGELEITVCNGTGGVGGRDEVVLYMLWERHTEDKGGLGWSKGRREPNITTASARGIH